MMTDTSSASRYALSFASGALLMREAVIAAPLYLRARDRAKVRALIEEDNLLQARTVASGRRFARETAQRLAVLTDAELELLTEAVVTERGHLLWAAACRRYDLIGEFAEEVLRERFLLLASSLDYDDFDSFIRTKALWHEELADLKDSTLRRLRSNVFLMLVEDPLSGSPRRSTPQLPQGSRTIVNRSRSSMMPTSPLRRGPDRWPRIPSTEICSRSMGVICGHSAYRSRHRSS